MSDFDDILFPLGISMGSTTGPEFSTDVTETAGGFEKRNQNWSGARLRFNVASGVRSTTDYEQLLAFFYARAGRARGFRFRDWSDWKSCALRNEITPTDQVLGVGDGARQFFDLIKTYSSGGVNHHRRIRRPVAGSIRIALGGIEQATGFSADHTTGRISFTTPPSAGVIVTAGYAFDVPARFDIDRLESTAPAPGMMQFSEIPIIEIRQ